MLTSRVPAPPLINKKRKPGHPVRNDSDEEHTGIRDDPVDLVGTRYILLAHPNCADITPRGNLGTVRRCR